jgi:hypothetical protein
VQKAERHRSIDEAELAAKGLDSIQVWGFEQVTGQQAQRTNGGAAGQPCPLKVRPGGGDARHALVPQVDEADPIAATYDCPIGQFRVEARAVNADAQNAIGIVAELPDVQPTALLSVESHDEPVQQIHQMIPRASVSGSVSWCKKPSP